MKVLSVVVLSSLLLSGCTWFQKSEQDSFVEATVKATCHIFQSENVFDPKVNEEAKAIYKDFGFDVADEAKMTEIATKYSSDEAVKTLIKDGIQKECGSSVPEGMFSEPAATDTTTPTVDDTATPTTDATGTTTPTTPTPATPAK